MPVLTNSDQSVRTSSGPPRFARSGQMVNTLRQEMLYSEKRARDLIFAAIAQSIERAQAGSLMVARLTREAAAAARDEAERTGYEFNNWDNATKAVVKALLSSESILDPAGCPIPFGVSAHASLVGSLREDYQDRAEAFLLAFLLDRLGDVTVRDHMALAHALFRQFDRTIPMEDLEDRVVILLARIADRVALEGDTYTVREM